MDAAVTETRSAATCDHRNDDSDRLGTRRRDALRTGILLLLVLLVALLVAAKTEGFG